VSWWWPWKKRAPPTPRIPPHKPKGFAPVITPQTTAAKPKEPEIIVEEIDTSAMTRTGVHKAWRRLTGQDK